MYQAPTFTTKITTLIPTTVMLLISFGPSPSVAM